MSVQPVNRSSLSIGFSLQQVVVEQVIPARGLAICKEVSTLHRMEVPLLPIRVRTPKVGEIWLIDQQFGFWSFAATIQTISEFAAGAGTIGLPTFCMSGVLVVRTGTGRIYNPTDRVLTITMVRSSVEIPPTGSAVVTELCIDGVSAGLTLTLPVDDHTVKRTCAISWPVDSYLSVDVTSVGSTYAGNTLTYSVTAA